MEPLPKPGCILSPHSLCAASGWRQKTTVHDFSLIFPRNFHTPSSTRAEPQPHHTCLTFHKIIIRHQQLTAVTSLSRLMTSATARTPSQHSTLVTPSHQRHSARLGGKLNPRFSFSSAQQTRNFSLHPQKRPQASASQPQQKDTTEFCSEAPPTAKKGELKKETGKPKASPRATNIRLLKPLSKMMLPREKEYGPDSFFCSCSGTMGHMHDDGASVI